MKNPLLDKNFLVDLDQYHEKEVWAKIIALDINEQPQEEITGRVTQGGSVNIDGTSAIRRSVSLSMVAKDVDVNSFYWGLHTKFKLLMGLTNKINPKYPDIIWFPQGTYVLTSFNTSQSTNSFNISLQGKDKMCLLNGEIGGTLTAPIDFGKLEERDDEGNLTITDIPIKDIIKEAVHEYAREPWHNIIVNDLEDLGIELLEYRGSKPLYMLIDENTGEVTNLTMSNSFKLYKNGSPVLISDFEDQASEGLNKLNEFYPGMKENYFVGYLKEKPGDNDHPYSVAKVEYGQTAGYRLTDITYPGDLIANQGDSLTSILDKLVQMLGQFEYFYDLDGRFVFQKKKTYIQTTWNNLIVTENEETIADIDATPYGYEFKGNDLTISFSNNPNLTGLKNDFSIWGTRTSAAGAEIPIHLRYAIDHKPWYYKTVDKENPQVYIAHGSEFIDLSLLPDCLKNGNFEGQWWDIHSWANLYKDITGAYPDGIMGTYGNRTCKLDLNQYFPKGTTWDKNRPLFLFEVNADGTLGNCGHNPSKDGIAPIKSCTAHKYSYFIDKAKNGVRSFIYDPIIPIDMNLTYHVVDWREIIYQMAKDYRKHNHEDDFLVRLRDNNYIKGKYLYPDGYTGYEQYYIDLEGFWRQLYNPNFMVDDKKLNLGGDGPIETEIELNEFGTFNGVSIDDVYIYPLKPINNIEETLKDKDDKDVEENNKKVLRHSPEKALLLETGSPYNVSEFIKTIYLNKDVQYYLKYLKDEKPKEVNYEIAKAALITSILIKKDSSIDNSIWDYAVTLEKNYSKTWIIDEEYIRLVDYEYLLNTSNSYNPLILYYQSSESEKLTDLKNTNYSGLYFKDREKNILWPSYFTEEKVKDSEKTYLSQRKINFYYTTYNYYGFEGGEKQYWNKNVWDAPELLNFWFDFMDSQGKMNDYSVSVVGNRPKVVNDTNIKSIYFRETPTVIFINKSNIPGWEFTERKSGYTYIQLPDSMLSLFRMSGQGKSAWNMLEECMYNDTYCIESASITTIPIYYLQPNTKIYIRDDNSKIDGEYLVSRFTLPLTYNGTMSISATKIAERIY